MLERERALHFFKKYYRPLTFILFAKTFSFTIYSLQKIVNTRALDFYILTTRAREILNGEVHKSFNPPYALLIYVPFNLIPYFWAQAIFLYLSLFSIIGSAYLVVRIVFKKDILFLTILTLMFLLNSFPAKFTLGMGQNNAIAYVLLLSSYYLFKNKKPRLSGILLALAASVKAVFAFVLLFYLVKREKRVITYFLLSMAVIVLLSILVFGVGPYFDYVTGVFSKIVNGTYAVYYNQSIYGFLARLFGDNPVIVKIARVFTVLVVSVLIVAGLKQDTKSDIKKDLYFSSFLVGLTMIEPTSWQHHFVWLLFPFVVLAGLAVKQKSMRLNVLLVIAYLLVAWNFKQPKAVTTFPATFLLSNQFYSSVILFTVLVYSLIEDGRSKFLKKVQNKFRIIIYGRKSVTYSPRDLF